MYNFFKKIAFKLDPEKAHHLGLKSLKWLNTLGLAARLGGKIEEHPVEVMGIRFSNPVGLAAGLDKDGICVDALGSLGFGFLEIGTVTPRPQPGNEKPRLNPPQSRFHHPKVVQRAADAPGSQGPPALSASCVKGTV